MKLGHCNLPRKQDYWLPEMARLSSCWFLIDHVLLREGFERWRRLSFFVHPVFLVLFQLFRLQQLLFRGLSDSLFCAFQIVYNAVMSVFLCVENWRSFLFHISEVDEVSAFASNTCSDQQEGKASEIFAQRDMFQRIVTHDDCHGSLQVHSLRLYLKGSADTECEESTLHEERPNIYHSTLLWDNYTSARYGQIPELEETEYELADEDDQESPPIGMVEDSDSPLPISTLENHQCGQTDKLDDDDGYMMQREDDRDIDDDSSLPSASAPFVLEFERGRVEIDLFYENYNERMRWFDQLNVERRFAVSAILNKKLGTTSLNDRAEPLIFSFPLTAHKKLAKSIKSDFEVVYVGQTCLSWEALCHQYRKVKVIVLEKDAHRGCFQAKVAEKFQQFQILLERFTENEKSEGKRFWNYANTRFCNANLLQVPDVSGYVEDEGEGLVGETTKASKVLEVMEKAVSSFWLFLRSDKKKSRGILKKLKLIDCKVEDPRDLDLFTSLSKEAHKKNMKVKALLKKSRWMRTTPGEEIQVENLISMIDIDLVIRVLKMSVVTSAQLKWCQEKLNCTEFQQRTFGTSSSIGCLSLFPYS